MIPSSPDAARPRFTPVERKLQADPGRAQIQPSVSFELAPHAHSASAGAHSASPDIARIVVGQLADAIPQAVAGLVAKHVAGIVDFVGSSENGVEFAGKLEEVFGDLGILQPGWRPRAEEAFPDDAAPIPAPATEPPLPHA